MRIQFDGVSLIQFYLGGNPEKMDQIESDELAGIKVGQTTSAQELADKLIDVAFWIYANERRFPEDDVDCWIEIDIKERNP